MVACNATTDNYFFLSFVLFTFVKWLLAMYNCYTECVACSYTAIIHKDQTKVERENHN